MNIEILITEIEKMAEKYPGQRSEGMYAAINKIKELSQKQTSPNIELVYQLMYYFKIGYWEADDIIELGIAEKLIKRHQEQLTKEYEYARQEGYSFKVGS